MYIGSPNVKTAWPLPVKAHAFYWDSDGGRVKRGREAEFHNEGEVREFLNAYLGIGSHYVIELNW